MGGVQEQEWKKCKNCTVRHLARPGKKYCSAACRWMGWYKRTHEEDTCVYCGLRADTKDHVPPQCVRPFLERVRETRFKFLLVPACRECNCALGAKTLWTVRERKDYIKRWLEERYARVLAIPGWTDEEIKAVGPNLQTEVMAGLALRDLTRRRLRW